MEIKLFCHKNQKKCGIGIDDGLDIINELNDHFVNISNIISKLKFKKETFHSLQLKLDIELQGHKFDIKYITPFEVKQIIEKLDVNKSIITYFYQLNSIRQIRFK